MQWIRSDVPRGRFALLCAGCVQGCSQTLHTFSRWGTRAVQGVQGVQGLPRACARVFNARFRGYLKNLLPREDKTLHTLHTLLKRWGTRAENVQGYF